MKLFKAVVLVQVTTCTDGCCVYVSRHNSDVFARDEAHAQEVVKKLDPRASVEVESMEDKGEVPNVANPGVCVGPGTRVFHGQYDKSPFYRKASSEKQE